jgi:hypothetical protein
VVQFLDPGDGPPAIMQGMAAQALGCLAANAEDAVTTVALGVIPLLVQFLKPVSPGPVSYAHATEDLPAHAAVSLWRLAAYSENAVTIASAGAIPLLVQLKSGSSFGMEGAAGALKALSALSENAVTTAAGAIPPLVHMSRSDAELTTPQKLLHSKHWRPSGGVAENRAAAAAKASADMVQAMERLGVDRPPDALSP